MLHRSTSRIQIKVGMALAKFIEVRYASYSSSGSSAIEQGISHVPDAQIRYCPYALSCKFAMSLCHVSGTVIVRLA
jgi:hypothetical protein